MTPRLLVEQVSWGNTGKVQVEEEKEHKELCSVPVCSGGKAKGWEPGELLQSLPGPPTYQSET